MLRLKSLLACILITLVGISCSSDEEKPRLDENGLTPEINRLVSQENLDALVDLGFVINRGGTPPILSGQFQVSPCYIAKSTAGDIEGSSTRDIFLNLYDQEELTISVDFKQLTQEANDIGSYIVGADNKFSIFVEVSELNTSTGSRAKVLYAISGQKTSSGIADIRIANLMLDNFGNPSQIWMANGKGRVFMDRDNLASLIP